MFGDTIKAGRSFSADVVRYLRRSMTLNEIGKLIGLSESFISLVGKGKRSFTIEHLIALEASLKRALPLLMLEALEESVSDEMKPQYEELHGILEKSNKLRTSMMREKKGQKVERR